jgi:hypothetical protein
VIIDTGEADVTEQDRLVAAVQEVAWELARQRAVSEGGMDVASPWEPGLSQDQRRRAWLATLSALEAVRVEAGRLAEDAAARAVEYGAEPEEVGKRAGGRWSRLFSRAGENRAGESRESGAALGVLSANGRAASSRLDNLFPM